jgi:hypothetical protein
MKTNKLPPATCGEAADRIKFEGDYGVHAHLMKEPLSETRRYLRPFSTVTIGSVFRFIS